MGQIVINYPNGKALRIYNGLIESFGVSRETWDDTLTPPGYRPSTDAELKADTDAAIRDHLRARIRRIEERDVMNQAKDALDASYVETEITE